MDESVGVSQLVRGFLDQAVDEKVVVLGQPIMGVVETEERDDGGAPIQLSFAEDVGEDGDEQIHGSHAEDAAIVRHGIVE